MVEKVMNISDSDFNYLINSITSSLIKLLMERRGLSFKDALDKVYLSDTYAKLLQSDSGLYAQSPGYVFEFLEHELDYGELG